MPNSKLGDNKWVTDIRPDKIEEYSETSGSNNATYKFVETHPIIGGILNKLAYFKTHVAAVWYNKLAGITLKDKLDEVDTSISGINSNLKTFGIIEIDISGTNIDKKDSGVPGYYVHIDISDKLPEGAVPFSVTFGSYDTPVSADVLHGRNAITLRSDESYAIGTNYTRKVFVHYYV